MCDRNFGKHKVRERSLLTGSPAGARADLDVSDDRPPSRNKRLKKHHCHHQINGSEGREEYVGCESTAATDHDAHESQGVTVDGSNQGSYSLADASNAQLAKHKVDKNKSIQSASSRRKKQKAIKKARKAAAEREAAKIEATKAGMERPLDLHIAKSTTDETRGNLVQKRPKGEGRKARKKANRKKRKKAQSQKQQDHTAIGGAAEELISQDEAEEAQSSMVPSKDLKTLKRATKKARTKERASHEIENTEAVQASTDSAGIQGGAPLGLVIDEGSLYPRPTVKHTSAHVPDIAQSPPCVSPTSVDGKSSCPKLEIADGSVIHGVKEIAHTGPFGTIDGSARVVQEGAQIQEGTAYELPGPGEKHWCKLTLEQRMAKIDLDPIGSDYGRKRFIRAKVEDGPVYASIVDLSCSSETLDMLIYWLHSRVVSQVPATGLGNTLLAHTWKLLEFVLRDNEDKLGEIKTSFKYTRKLAPRIQKWETVQLKTEKTFAEIESLWGKNWNEQCVMETDTAGLQSVKWKRSIVKQVKKLAGTAIERNIGRGEAWGLVLKEVLAKGERAAVVAEDVCAVIETLIER